MLNRHSAIKQNYNVGKFPFNDEIGIFFSENYNLTIQQIAAWPEEILNVEKLFSDQVGIHQQIDFNQGEVMKNNSLWRMEPLKWWLLGSTINLPENLGTSLELSHAFTSIKVSGETSEILLNRHLPLDLRLENFPIHSSASSAIHHVSVKLFRLSAKEFNLFIPRGFALSIWEILLQSASQFGYEIKDS
jgi:heterotetrameric sarcosine oxidase gamma subunit